MLKTALLATALVFGAATPTPANVRPVPRETFVPTGTTPVEFANSLLAESRRLGYEATDLFRLASGCNPMLEEFRQPLSPLRRPDADSLTAQGLAKNDRSVALFNEGIDILSSAERDPAKAESLFRKARIKWLLEARRIKRLR